MFFIRPDPKLTEAHSSSPKISRMETKKSIKITFLKIDEISLKLSNKKWIIPRDLILIDKMYLKLIYQFTASSPKIASFRKVQIYGPNLHCSRLFSGSVTTPYSAPSAQLGCQCCGCGYWQNSLIRNPIII